MDPRLIVLLAAVAIGMAWVAGVAYWYYRRRSIPVAPQYVSGGANYMITLGIGTPAEIAGFLLFGLSTGGVTPPVANRKSGHKSGYPFRGFY